MGKRGRLKCGEKRVGLKVRKRRRDGKKEGRISVGKRGRDMVGEKGKG